MKAPLASIIIPAFEFHHTLGTCLESIRAQQCTDFELIVVDSSPEDRARVIVESVYPNAIYFHSAVRLLPQAARNYGAHHARGEVLVFTDPDIYPPPLWLDTLLAAWREGHPVVLGAIACQGKRWIDRGAHLCKFAICLPAGEARQASLGWSGNILVTRTLFESLGGWEAERTQGDSVFTARVRQAGYPLWFEPKAIVFHDHERLNLLSFLAERRMRGAEFAEIEVGGALGESRWATPVIPRRLLPMLGLLPLRIANRAMHIGIEAHRAGLAGDFVQTLPVVLLGVTAWYLGMAQTYWKQACANRPQS